MRRKALRVAGCVGAVLLTVSIGLLLAWLPAGEALAGLSYDLPFLFRGHIAVPEVAIVYLDRASHEELQPSGGPLDRRYHVELLKRLKRDAAKLVFYDVLFFKDQPADGEFAQAIREHGAVVLGGDYQNTREQGGNAPAIPIRQIHPPNRLLREAAAGWGLLKLQPVQFDFSARRIFAGLPEQESAVWAAARAVGAGVASQNRLRERWANFYGPAFWFDQVSFRRALLPDGVTSNFFRGKTVFIGGHPSLVSTTGERDLFATPYTRFAHSGQNENMFAPGVEMLATAFLNLVRSDWLERVSERKQLGIVLVYGIVAGIGLLFLRPWLAALVACLAGFGIAVMSCSLQAHQHLWWSWMIPATVQTPLALIWSIGWQYGVESRKRRQLRKAFSAYVSPHLADRIADSDFDLTPGGQEMEVTVMFTDLEKFTAMAETLPPKEVSRILSSYFEETSREILAQEGTINKYIGDSVMAVWGAPLPDGRQADRAVAAAQRIIQTSSQRIAGQKLRTRIGINTGIALAGNLGSSLRFDYTVVGAVVNLASRLESLNKVLGTDILITESTRRKLSSDVPVRFLGNFLVKGMEQPTAVYQALDSAAAKNGAAFDKALEFFAARDLDKAEAHLREAEAGRGLNGPIRFYLEEIGRRRKLKSHSGRWDTIVPAAKT